VFEKMFVIEDINTITVDKTQFIDILKELGYLNRNPDHSSRKEAKLLKDAWDCIKTNTPSSASFMNIAVFLSLINNVYIEKEKKPSEGTVDTAL
jgi:hypothetical protein